MENTDWIQTDKQQKIKYVICFPPGRIAAGNFLERTLKLLLWSPRQKWEYVCGGEEDLRILFMEDYPLAKRYQRMAEKIFDRRIQKYVQGYENAVIHRMEDKEDYPALLYYVMADRFFKDIRYKKHTRIGIVEGEALPRRALIDLLRGCVGEMIYLVVFTKEAEGFREFAADAEEKYGLIVTLTDSLKEVSLCDYVLDCSILPFDRHLKCKDSVCFFSLYADARKLRSLRGGVKHFDSCTAILDRAFHNRV